MAQVLDLALTPGLHLAMSLALGVALVWCWVWL